MSSKSKSVQFCGTISARDLTVVLTQKQKLLIPLGPAQPVYLFWKVSEEAYLSNCWYTPTK